MKKNNLLYLFAIALGLGSCTKQLTQNPSDQISVTQSFKTMADGQSWDYGVYSNLRGRAYGIYTYTTDVQGDQLNASIDFGNRNGGPQRWDWTADDYSLSGIWSGYYYGITNANLILAGIGNITPSSAADIKTLQQYKGDAYMARAYYYSQLVLRWGKAYSSASSSDLGVPVVLTYDIKNWPARSSVSDVYKQIIKDLDSAQSNLSTIAGKQGSNKFTIDVVAALRARVLFYMNDWTNAKKYADQLINSKTYPLYTTAATINGMWLNDNSGEDIMQLYSDLNELPNTNAIYLSYSTGSKGYIPDFVPSKWVVNLYNGSDLRRNVYFSKLPVTFSTANKNLTDSLFLVNKYPGNPVLWAGSANSNYANKPKVFRIAEDYLISSEAAYMGGDITSALTTLNVLRQARGLNAITTTSADLLDSIKTERTRELAFEGFRIDDLKRWNLSMTRHDPQNTLFLAVGPLYYGLTEPAGANKFVWGIPTNDIVVNPAIKQNAGW